MRLRLYFSGMQLFVPAPNGNPRVQVVMPVAAGHHGEQHTPLLVVNMGHLTPSGTKGAGWFVHPLRSRVLTIPGTVLNTRICPEIVDLREVTNRLIDPSALEQNGNEKAAARVDLYAGQMGRVEDGACWHWNSANPRPCAHGAEWDIPWTGASVALELKDWWGTSKGSLPMLYPLDGGDTVEVHILHLPEAELPFEERMPHVPSLGAEAPHFGHYFSLLDGYATEARPRFAAKPGHCGTMPGGCEKISWQGASPYTCMLATLSRPTEV